MLKGLSLSARAMKNQVSRNDIIANNLANATTSGFKKEIAVFHTSTNGETRGQSVLLTATSFVQGTLVKTENPLDMAIEGDGFFVVETDDGEMYTRSGAFVKDGEGYLSTVDGHRVLSTSATIQLPAGEVGVSKEGIVTVNGVEVGRVRVVRFQDPSKLEKIGSGLFRANDGAGPEDVPEEEVSILSGYLEQSNVEVIKEMTDMITALKAYEIAQKAFKAEDEVLQHLTRTVGRVGNV